jgi:hypothetical protein
MLLGNATKAELRLIVWCRGVDWLRQSTAGTLGSRRAHQRIALGFCGKAVVIAQYFVSVAGIE